MSYVSPVRLTVEGFEARLPMLAPPTAEWRPTRVCLHHTYIPSDRVEFDRRWLTRMQSLRRLYEGRGWHAGPHLFMTERYVYQLSALTQPGVHAKAFNGDSIGVEVVGNFGPGPGPYAKGERMPPPLKRSVARVVGALDRHFGLPAASLVFHRDDPQAHKTCPGTYVDKAEMVGLVAAHVAERVPTDAIEVNGHRVRGFVVDGVVWVAVREFADACGADITADSNAIVVSLGPRRVALPTEHTYVQSGRAHYPLRQLAESLKGRVVWSHGEATAIIP